MTSARPEPAPAASEALPPQRPESTHSASLGAWAWVLMLCIAQIVSTMDRGMLALVIDPVRAELQISELQIALLIGFAFGLFYVTVGLPMGLLADRTNRHRLLLAGLVIWSLATMGGGLARSFGEMFVSRLFIGVGEAVLAPCAVTIISDCFAPNARGRPMALYVFGSMTAYGVGKLIIGYVLQLAPGGAFDVIPALRGLAPWRVAFLLAGAMGLVLALLMLPLREPSRRLERSDASAGPARTLNWREALAQFVDRRRLLLPFYACLAMFGMGSSVANGWGPVLLTRVFGFDAASAGKGLGVAHIVWALVGAVLASIAVDRVARAAGSAGKFRLAAAVALCAIPSSWAVASGSGPIAVAMLGEITFASAIFGTTMLSVVPEITSAGARGFAVALYAFVVTMIGGSLGPLFVATLTERVFGDPTAVGTSMAIVGTIALIASAAFALVAARAALVTTHPIGATRVSSATPGRP